MRKDQELIVWLQQTFQTTRQVNECLHKSTSTATTVCETSKEDDACIFHQEDTEGFRIKNPTKKEIHLLATDHCFFTATDPARCDCIVFDDRYWCFVELKLNIKRWANYKDNARDAVEQLGKTILFFDDLAKHVSESFFGYTREAYIVTHDHIYPKSQTSRETRRVSFLQTYKVRLEEANNKEF